MNSRIDAWLLALLIAGAGFRLFWIDRPAGEPIFDENYYVQDARVLLGRPVTWRNLPGYAHTGFDPNAEHPPLAKLIMAGSMRVFGDRGLGWRLPSVVLSMLAIALLYAIALAAGATRSQARLAAFLMTFENMTFLHGRLAMLDIYAVVFMLLGIWLYLKRGFELAGVAFALATLCKELGAFGVIAVGLFEIGSAWRHRDLGRLRPLGSMTVAFVGFGLLALGALDGAFTPYRNPIRHLRHIAEVGKSLTQKVPQGIASRPSQWWLNDLPIVYYEDHVVESGMTRTTVLFRCAMTEYVVLAAPFALLFAAVRAWRGSRLGALAISLFIANYVPFLAVWLLFNRTSYLYYMLSSIPAIALAIALCVSELPRMIRWAFIGGVLYSFAVWFPFRWY